MALVAPVSLLQRIRPRDGQGVTARPRLKSGVHSRGLPPERGKPRKTLESGNARAGFPPAGRCRLVATGNILIADDDAAIRTVLSQALSRAGYDVRTTGNAATLWRWVQSGEGDLVITDVIMPDENAFELLPKMKKLRPNLPIIVMSAQNTFMTAIKASERGAYDYLPKPSTCGNWFRSSGGR